MMDGLASECVVENAEIYRAIKVLSTDDLVYLVGGSEAANERK